MAWYILRAEALLCEAYYMKISRMHESSYEICTSLSICIYWPQKAEENNTDDLCLHQVYKFTYLSRTLLDQSE